jgi:protein TonB
VRLVAALGFSLLVHAVAAFMASRHAPEPHLSMKPAPAQTATRVVLFTRAADPPAAVAPVAAARVEAPSRPARAPRTAATELPARPAPEAAKEAPEGDQPGTDPAAPETAVVVATGYPGSGMDTVEVAAPGPAAPTFDVAALHARLAASAQRCYPAAARRFGLAGEVELDFCLDAAGALSSHRLARSSGQSLLDSAAVDCVLQGAQPFPAEAFGGCYSVPVRFGR